jgi:hypothetical protein
MNIQWADIFVVGIGALKAFIETQIYMRIFTAPHYTNYGAHISSPTGLPLQQADTKV